MIWGAKKRRIMAPILEIITCIFQNFGKYKIYFPNVKYIFKTYPKFGVYNVKHDMAGS